MSNCYIHILLKVKGKKKKNNFFAAAFNILIDDIVVGMTWRFLKNELCR